MDTVEWGSAEPSGRRLPSLRFSIPLAGAVTLAGLGFLALLVSELQPWATVQLSADVASTVRPAGSALTNGAGLGLDRIGSGDVIAYHLGAVAVLAALGFGLAGPVARRRLAVGVAVGAAAGEVLSIISVARAGHNVFNNLYGGFEQLPAGISTVTGPGVYLAFAGVALLVASAVTSAFPRRGGPASPPSTPPAAYPTAGYGLSGGDPATAPETVTRPDAGSDRPAAQDPARAGDVAGAPGDGRPGGPRDLTVSAAEPLDERYFARPEKE